MGLVEHRREMDEIDRKIIMLIDQRTNISKKIFEDKRIEGRPIADPDRENQVLKKAMDMAAELSLDAGSIRDIFRILISMSLQKQHELHSKNRGYQDELLEL